MKVSNEILAVLSDAHTEGNQLVLMGQLDRRLYEQANKVLETAGGKWNRKAKAHLFEGDAAEAIEQVILSGEIATHQDFDYFPTPWPIVKRLMELSDIGPSMTVLEPSAGTGNIMKAVPAWARVDCIELRPEYAASIPRSTGGFVLVSDFLKVEPMRNGERYDRVTMNPPFRNQADIKHVLHALKFLKPGGRLVSVMSAGVTFRHNKLTEGFRRLVADRGGTMETNPDDSFKAVGTLVQTITVSIPGRELRP